MQARVGTPRPTCPPCACPRYQHTTTNKPGTKSDTRGAGRGTACRLHLVLVSPYKTCAAGRRAVLQASKRTGQGGDTHTRAHAHNTRTATLQTCTSNPMQGNGSAAQLNRQVRVLNGSGTVSASSPDREQGLARVLGPWRIWRCSQHATKSLQQPIKSKNMAKTRYPQQRISTKHCHTKQVGAASPGLHLVLEPCQSCRELCGT